MSSDSQSRVPYSHRRSVQSLLKNKFLGLFQYHCFNAIFEKIIFFGCTGSPLLCVGFLWLWPAGVTLHCDVQASHCGGFLLRSTGSRRTDFSSCSLQALELRVVVVCWLGCAVACGIFPNQGLNPCPLHWQADSYPLRQQVSPQCHFYLQRTVSSVQLLSHV